MRILAGALSLVVSLVASPLASAAPSASDSEGRTVTLKAPAARIVSLAPHVTELIYAIGAGDRLVGVSEYSDYPPAAKGLPRVSSSGGVDLEKVLALRPDLVVAWRFEATRGALDRLEKLGLPVFLSEPRQLSDIAANMEALGALTGSEAGARAAASALRAGLARLQRTYAGSTQLRVFYHLSVRPLMSLNGRHMVSSALALCGAHNVFADAASIAPVVDAEAVLAADPDVVVAAARDPRDPAWQAHWKTRFAGLRAVREGNLIAVDATLMHRQGPRILQALESLCVQLDEVRRRSAAAAAAKRDPAATAGVPASTTGASSSTTGASSSTTSTPSSTAASRR